MTIFIRHLDIVKKVGRHHIKLCLRVSKHIMQIQVIMNTIMVKTPILMQHIRN